MPGVQASIVDGGGAEKVEAALAEERVQKEARGTPCMPHILHVVRIL